VKVQTRVAHLVGRPLFWVAIIGFLFTGPIVRAVRTRLPPTLPVLGTLPEFQLTDEQGQPFGSRELRGRIWVANFIFTRCPTICPVLTARMSKFQDHVRNLEPMVRLVSFSVDPEHDTPAILAAYAREHRASPRLWSFLTGPYDLLRRTVVEGLKVAMGPDEQNAANVFHGTHVVLVDTQLRIRGYYDLVAPEGQAQLLSAMSMLAARGD
jgi:protein SCO1/2